MIKIWHKPFDFIPIPIEITRDNWIVANYYDNVMDTKYEIHYVTTDKYKQGILIDDVWAQKEDDVFANKVDIYVLANGVKKSEDFIMKNAHLFFLNYRNVKKEFIIYDDCPTEFQDYIKEKVFVSVYTNNKGPASNTKPVLSLITTVFNNTELLEQTIQSVINQTSCDFEYIVKDANSKDGFEDLLAKYQDCGIKVIRSKDRGIYDGMDQGIRAANGVYVEILNSDDMFYGNNVVSTYIQEIRNSNEDAYCSDICMKFPNGRIMQRKADLSKLRYRSCVNHTSLVMKKADYIKLGGFDLALPMAADCDLTIKMVKAKLNIKHLNFICVRFRADGASNTVYTIKMLKENLICRYRFSAFNVIGYCYSLLQFLKMKIYRF